MNANDINKVAVIGAGIMGEGIALHFAQAGLHVQLIDMDLGILEKDGINTRIDQGTILPMK